LLRKLSRAIRFAPILICSKSHRPLTLVWRNYSPQQRYGFSASHFRARTT
jgi:hypothetical protein